MAFIVFVVLIVLACLGAVAFMLAEKKATHVKENRSQLEELRASGADLSQPHEIEFFFVAPAGAAAQALQADLEAGGFEAETVEDEAPSHYVVIARKRLVPDELALSTLRQEHMKRASQHGGRYDGWEVSLESSDDP